MQYITVVLFVISFNTQALPPGGSISLSWPIDRSVLQRSNSGQVSVFFAGQFLPFTSCSPFSLKYKVDRLNLIDGSFQSTELNWTVFTANSNGSGQFYSSRDLSTGWYALTVQANDPSSGNELASASVRFGVGDVYVVAGQSNAQGIELTSISDLPSESQYDCVSVTNLDRRCAKETDRFPVMSKLINQIDPRFFVGLDGPTSWCYAILGKRIADFDGTPTAFFDAANGGSSVLNWQQSSNNNGQTNGYAGQYCSDRASILGYQTSDFYGQPYLTFKNTLKYYAKIFGVKAVLWHQGETDTVNGTDSNTYKNLLEATINQSWSDFGNSNLTWYVARALRSSPSSVSPDVIAGQNAVINDGYAKAGPATDDNLTRIDGQHFYQDGLVFLGEAWRNSINANPTSNVFTAPFPLNIYSSYLGGNSYQFTADGNYSQYVWVSSDGNRNSPYMTGQTIYPTAGSYRCYAQDQAGNWFISPKLYASSACNTGLRIAADGNSEVLPRCTIVSNPVIDALSTIELSLPEKAYIKLEIVDMKGVQVKKLADNVHSPGKFTYPLLMSDLPAGTYLCRF